MLLVTETFYIPVNDFNAKKSTRCARCKQTRCKRHQCTHYLISGFTAVVVLSPCLIKVLILFHGWTCIVCDNM